MHIIVHVYVLARLRMRTLLQLALNVGGDARRLPCRYSGLQCSCNVSQQSAVRMRFWGGTGLSS